MTLTSPGALINDHTDVQVRCFPTRIVLFGARRICLLRLSPAVPVLGRLASRPLAASPPRLTDGPSSVAHALAPPLCPSTRELRSWKQREISGCSRYWMTSVCDFGRSSAAKLSFWPVLIWPDLGIYAGWLELGDDRKSSPPHPHHPPHHHNHTHKSDVAHGQRSRRARATLGQRGHTRAHETEALE